MLIEAEKVVYPGKCIAHNEAGKTLFLDYVLPGEEINVLNAYKKKGILEVIEQEIITASPKRIVPRCPSFGVCGGCSLQHTSYANQLELKQQYAQELFDPLKLELKNILPCGDEWHYRNKIELSFGTDERGEMVLGFHKKRSFDRYITVPPCFIADEDFLPLIDCIREFALASGLGVYSPHTHEGFWRHIVLRKGKRTGDVLVNIITNKNASLTSDFFRPLLEKISSKITSATWTLNANVSDAIIPDEVIPLFGENTIFEQLVVQDKTYRFIISPFSFFQTNTSGAEVLYSQVLEYLQPEKDETVLDLFCGTGTIGITVAPYVKKVHGVEIVESAIENARENARFNGTDNIEFEAISAEKWVKSNAQKFDAIIVDPPRSGLSPRVVEHIMEIAPKKIVYVSCNPSTMARDLKMFMSENQYRMTSAVPVDMFPQTYHVEVVAGLERVAK